MKYQVFLNTVTGIIRSLGLDFDGIGLMETSLKRADTWNTLYFIWS